MAIFGKLAKSDRYAISINVMFCKLYHPGLQLHLTCYRKYYMILFLIKAYIYEYFIYLAVHDTLYTVGSDTTARYKIFANTTAPHDSRKATLAPSPTHRVKDRTTRCFPTLACQPSPAGIMRVDSHQS